MNVVSTSPSSSAAAAAPALAGQNAVANPNTHETSRNAAAPLPGSGYGLPCLKCRTYYDSNLTVCPVCKESKRVAVNAVSVRTLTPEARDSAAVEEQRRRVARELNPEAYSSVFEAPLLVGSQCTLKKNHAGDSNAAEVCQSCYTDLQNRADLMEAALHVDLKEAAQVIYEAVWADPSDPTKTYQNAAQALLTELHKRAGISAVIAPVHPMSH
ncbi:MAG TPA: hypothetical protein VGG46_08365 [Terriglobales bacterium]